MKLTLALLAGIVGLVVTASAVMLIWLVLQQQKQRSKASNEQEIGQTTDELGTEKEAAGGSPWNAAAPLLLQWTYFDYALIGVFAVGSLFLFTDVIAVIRDAESYPLYHYGYLLCGFIFTLLSMLFMMLRFAAVLSLIRSGRALSSPDEHRHPGQADQAE